MLTYHEGGLEEIHRVWTYHEGVGTLYQHEVGRAVECGHMMEVARAAGHTCIMSSLSRVWTRYLQMGCLEDL